MNIPHEYTAARICYAVAFMILLVLVGHWIAFGRPEKGSWIISLIGAFVIFGSVGSLWVFSTIWVAERQHARLITGNTPETEHPQAGKGASPESKEQPTAKPEQPSRIEEVIRKRQELYVRFMEEKTRRIDLYAEGLLLLWQIYVHEANQQAIKPRVWPWLEQTLKTVRDKYDQWIKDKKNEDAIFANLIAEIQIYFKDSTQMRNLLKQPLKQIEVTGKYIEKPNQKDFENDAVMQNYAARASTSINEYIDSEIRRPLNELGEYLQRHLK